MREIPLTRSFVAIVDDDDFEALSRMPWRTQVNSFRRDDLRYIYAVTRTPQRPSILMHRMIAGVVDCGRCVIVDHYNHDTLDNRRSNLRVCTRSQNGANRSISGRSEFKGVSLDPDIKSGKRWRARLTLHGRGITIGRYATALEAAVAYNSAALDHFGEFALLNEVA